MSDYTSSDDRGEGPSTTPSLQATIRIRPITIRFTEPGLPDLHLRLHSTSLRPLAPRQQLIFDLDIESAPAPYDDSVKERLVSEVLASLTSEGLVGDETVREVKSRMDTEREGVRGRRMRLIHAGRVLKESVRLVGYLDEVDARRRGQRRQSSLLDVDDGTHESEDEDEEGGREEVVKKDLTVRELVDYLSSLSSSTPTKGSVKGKGKAREPAHYTTLLRLTTVTSPLVYLQCSVGSTLSPSTASPNHLANPTTDLPSINDDETNRGFNRLLTAGLSATEIASIRTHFRATHPLPLDYHPIQTLEYDAHLLEMEDSWMDSFHSPETADVPTGGYGTLMQGLMVGFFMPPLMPLFWYRDKAHPSAISGVGEGEGEEVDDEDAWERERSAGMGVFSSTMQISILFGVLANVIMGVFRVVW